MAGLAMVTSAGTLYAPVVAKLVHDWWEIPDYSHALLVAPLAAFLAWQRRGELARTTVKPSSAGLAIVLVSLVLLMVGRLGVELFLTRASLIGFVAGTIVFLFGWRHLRVLAFPLALLLLTIPVPSIVITRLTLSLQLFASRVAELVLVALGIPVLREGNVLVLPTVKLQVAEACSGIRSLMALVTLALIVARFSDTRWRVRAVILASAVPIAVLVNGMRVAASAIAAHWYGLVAVQGFVHELMGWLMFLVAFALMAACARAVGGHVPQRQRAVAR